jgi:hypothetical protein
MNAAEDVAVIDLAGAGFVAAGDVGEVVLADLVEAVTDTLYQIALHNLHMIDVEEELDVGVADTPDHVYAIFYGVEEVIGVVNDGVEEFDDRHHPIGL